MMGRPGRVRSFACHQQGGASAIEFAIVAPIFLLLVFGVIEFGRLFWTSHALHETAIAAARCISIPQTECASQGVFDPTRANAFIEGAARRWGIGLPEGAIAVAEDTTCEGMPGFGRVTLTHTFNTALPDMLTSLAGGTRLTASACFPRQSP